MAEEKKNTAAVLVKKGQFVLEQRPMPSNVGPNEVVVQIKAVGICGSDVHYWTHGRIGDFVVKKPMIIGHESAGVVVGVGGAVSGLKLGDRVALEPGVCCRCCDQCKTGRYNLCPDMKFFATPPIDGSLMNYVKHPADFCFKLPASVSFEEGAMCEPLSVGVYACRRANVALGHHVLITGCGPIGIICMLVARAFGAKRVVMTDVVASRRDFAKRMGADAVIDASKPTKEVVEGILAANENLRFHAAIECCGFTTATTTAISATKTGGCVCLVGLAEPEMKLPIFQVVAREVDIRGIFRYCNTYPTCVSLLEQKKVDVKPLITHRFPLSEVEKAFGVANSGKAIKVMFNL